MASGSAVVKSVLSGDTIVLLGAAKKGGPPPEMQVSLASLKAPRVSRHPEQTDEPFAFQSREFLRTLLIGKVVKFEVEYKVETINRQFASVYLESGNVNEMVARAGWAKVLQVDDPTKQKCSKHYDELQRLSAEAEKEKRGIFQEVTEESDAVRHMKWEVEDSSKLLGEIKGLPVPALIEIVGTGSVYRVYLPNLQQWITLVLAGVVCPKMKGKPLPSEDGESKSFEPEPYAREAKHFVETRLLQRDVNIIVNGIDKFNNFLGVVDHPKGNISVELLKQGLAKMADWSVAYVGDRGAISDMRNAERTAKLQKLRLWKNFVPSTAKLSGAKQFEGTVVEVPSGDTIVVRTGSSTKPEDRRINLSSIKAPRMGNQRRGDSGDKWGFASREFLRKLLIGRNVYVEVDYTRSVAPETQEERVKRGLSKLPDRVHSTVLLTRKSGAVTNVGLELVGAGLAEVVRHRAEDERGQSYDDLLEAEEKAKESKLKMWSSERAPIGSTINDVTGDSARATRLLPFLVKEDKEFEGVVEHVFAGGRCKITFPGDNAACMVSLSGVRCPQPARGSNAAEPFGEEAAQWMRDMCMHRDVLVNLQTNDKNGVALGEMWLVSGGQRGKNIGKELLKKGYATTIPGVITRMKNSEVYVRAEEDAKEARRGVWEDFQEIKEAEEKAEAGQDVEEVTVSEIVDGNNFFVQATNSAKTLEEVTSALEEMKTREGSSSASIASVKKGGLLAALFDDQTPGAPHWFRARLEARTKDSKGKDAVRVTFIDFGNKATVPVTQARPLEPELIRIRPLATECVLAFVRVPHLDEEFGKDAAYRFSDLVWGKTLTAKIHRLDDQKRLVVTLFDERDTCINAAMLASGIARISRRQVKEARSGRWKQQDSSLEGLISSLEKAQKEAKAARTFLWRFGDVGNSDDELQTVRTPFRNTSVNHNNSLFDDTA